jgi:hypothetical protein
MKATKKIAGYLVRDNCKREWFVPVAAVRADYIAFLMDADDLAEERATEIADATPDFLDTWFSEQCNAWRDVEDMGILVKDSTLFKTKKALDRHRNASGLYFNAFEKIEMDVNAIDDNGQKEDGASLARAPK